MPALTKAELEELLGHNYKCQILIKTNPRPSSRKAPSTMKPFTLSSRREEGGSTDLLTSTVNQPDLEKSPGPINVHQEDTAQTSERIDITSTQPEALSRFASGLYTPPERNVAAAERRLAAISSSTQFSPQATSHGAHSCIPTPVRSSLPQPVKTLASPLPTNDLYEESNTSSILPSSASEDARLTTVSEDARLTTVSEDARLTTASEDVRPFHCQQRRPPHRCQRIISTEDFTTLLMR